MDTHVNLDKTLWQSLPVSTLTGRVGLGTIAVSFEDLIAAFVGSLIFLGLLWGLQKSRRK